MLVLLGLLVFVWVVLEDLYPLMLAQQEALEDSVVIQEQIRVVLAVVVVAVVFSIRSVYHLLLVDLLVLV
jgi:hypothetical protein